MHAKQLSNKNTLQKVWYFPQINESSTSTLVVQETMKRAQKIAKECSRKTIAVTYDLAIAKSSMQLQGAESPTYDNLFITMGAFHAELTFFLGLGKYIEKSGEGTRLTRSWCNSKIFIKIFHYG